MEKDNLKIRGTLKGTGLNQETLLKFVKDYYDDAVRAKDDIYKVIAKSSDTNRASDTTQNMLSVYEMWYAGDQWTYDPNGDPIKDNGEIAKPVINYTKTIVDQRVDMLKRRRISFDTRPVGLEDIDISLAWQAIFKYIYKKRFHEDKVTLCYQDDLVFGTGFIKVLWNKQNDDEEGDIDLVVLNPLDVYPDRYGLDIPDMRYLHVIYVKPKEYVNKRYGVEEKEDEVLIKETWINPNIIDKDGYYVLWTDRHILDVRKLQDVARLNKIPIAAFRTKKTSANFWGTSLVRDIAHIQALHNKSIGLVIDNLIITNGGRVITTDPDLIMSNDRREIVHYQDGTQLSSLGLDTINPQWFNLIQYSSYSLAQALTGTYAVAAGGGANTTTASGIISLQQAGNTGVEADFKDISLNMSYLGKFIVRMVKDLYGEKRIKKILGTVEGLDNIDISKVLKKADEDFDIFINFGESLPEDRLSRNNLLLGMLQAGAITPEMLAKLTDNPELLRAVQEKKLAEQQQMKDMMTQMAAKTAGNVNPIAPQTPSNPVALQTPTNPLVETSKARVENKKQAVGVKSPV